MTTLGKGFKHVDGKLKPTKRKKDASAQIRERKSKKTRAVSPAKARTMNSIGKAKLWREGWGEPVRQRPGDVNPMENAFGLFWRPAPRLSPKEEEK